MRSAAAALAAMILVVGCGSTPAPTTSPARTSPPSTTPPPPSAPPSAASASGRVEADPSLLTLVPAAAAGLQLDYDPETTASVAADPALVRDATALAIGLAVPTGVASPSEFVIVNVVRLRNPAADDEWFRGWRDTYDNGACGQAGGVSGNAQAELNKHVVYIGTCKGGALTYHVRLAGGEIVLSLTSIGPGRPGERVMRALPP